MASRLEDQPYRTKQSGLGRSFSYNCRLNAGAFAESTGLTRDRRLSRREAFEQTAVEHEFSDLYGVERGAFAEIVADDPECEAVFDGGVFADARDVGGEFADAFDGRNVAAVVALINDHDAR